MKIFNSIQKAIGMALVVMLTVFSTQNLHAQCSGTTPSFAVDLTGNPDSMWISTSVQRAGLCCSASSPDRCIEFIVKLDPGSSGIILDIYSGAKPSGALFYSIGCAGSYAVGSPICLTSAGPHKITFCKPGSNTNQYYIRAIPKAKISPAVTVTPTCGQKLFLQGLVEDSIRWSSVPSSSKYDSFLSCLSGCDTVTVKPKNGFTGSVLYKGCGPVLGGCSTSKFCDTVRVYFKENLSAQIGPDKPVICYGNTSIDLKVQIKGGQAPYTVVWDGLIQDTVLKATYGTHRVKVTDKLGCSIAYDTVFVDSMSSIISAFPGYDTALCANVGNLQLKGTILGAKGAKWFGSGTFKASDTILTPKYYFTVSEKAAGSATISLKTTGTFGCPADSQSMKVTFVPVPAPVISGPDTVCANSAVHYSILPIAGSTYTWSISGGAMNCACTGNSISVLWGAAGPGMVTVKQTSPFGCDSTISKKVTIVANPAPVIVGTTAVCSNKRMSYSVTPIAGATYKWTALGGTIQGASNASSVSVLWNAAGSGSVSVTVVSKFGCVGTASKTISISPTPVPLIKGSDSICINSTKTYSVTAVSGSKYSWSVVNGVITGSSTGSSISVFWGTGGLGKVTVKQTSAAGCDSTVSLNTTIIDILPPVVMGADTLCSNDVSTFRIKSIKGYKYEWTATGGTIVGSSTDTIVRVLWGSAGAGKVYAKYISPFGCVGLGNLCTVVKISPKPAVTGNDTVCAYTNETYNLNAFVGMTTLWSVTGGKIIGSNKDSILKVYWGAPGTGKITVKQSNSLGCDSLVTINVLIQAKPKPSILGKDSVCSYKSTQFTAGSASGVQYTWTATGGTIVGKNTNNTVVVAWGKTGSGSVTLKLSSAAGCDSSVTKNIKIVPTPVPAIVGPDTVCINKSGVYSVTSVSGHSYLWTAVGGTIVGSKTTNKVTVLWTSAGTGKVTVKQTSTFGCDSTVSKNVRVMPRPTPSIVGTTNVCPNKKTTFSVTATAGNTYLWTVTGGSISGSATGASISVLWGNSASGSVSVKQTSAAGCDSIVSKNITILPAPNPVIAGADSVCSNKKSIYSVTSVSGSSFSWTVTGGAISGSKTGNSITVLWGAAGTGSVRVTQTNASGCDSTVSKNVRILPTPNPVITGTTTVCSNKTANYSITAVSGSTYSWTVTGGAISGSKTGNSISVLWGAAGTGIVSVKQISAFGCDSAVSKTITVVPTPAPVISGPDSICSNRTSNYSITAITGSTYSWTATGGTISGSKTSNSVKVLWNAAGTGSITVKQSSAAGCDSTVSKTISIVPTPTPVISGPDSICSNRTSNYSISAIAGSTYSWTATGGTISGSKTGNSIKVLWGAAGTGSVSVKQTSAFGCDSSVSKTIRIMPTPAPVISGPDSICANRTSNYSITAIAGSTYSWTATGGTISGSKTGNSIKVLWGTAGKGSVSVKQTSAFGCDSSVSKTITIMPTPAPAISGPDSICSNRTSTYSITAIAGSTYSWTATGGTISGSKTGNSINVLWGAAGTGSVSVKQTSAFGCDSSVSKTIRIMPTPAPVISGPDSICSNRASTYSITAIAGSTYSWTATGGTISGSKTGNSIKVLWGAAGTGSVSVKQTSAFGCDSSVSKAIRIMPTPAPVISGPDSICANRTSTYSITSIAGSTYSWTATGGTISGSKTGNSISVLWGAAGTGSVSVIQTSAFGCDSAVSKNITIVSTPAPVISGPDSICANRTATYAITSVTNSSYSWTVTGGTISGIKTGNSINVLWGTAGTGSVSVKQTNTFGCDSAVSKTIRIMPTPAPVISGPDSICSNRTSTYSITAIAGSTYSWTATGGTISGSASGNSISVLWGAARVGSVSVKQTSAFGCDSSVSKNITIVPTPVPVISGPDSICSNRTSTYSITAIVGSSYSWTATGGSIIGSATGNSISVLWGAAGVGSVQVKQISAFGCDSSVSKNITIVPTPAPVITGPDSICSNRTSSYSITAIAGSTYNWTATGGSICGNATGNSISVLWGAAGAGSVQVKQISAFGCDSSVSKNISIVPTPAPVISGPDSICSNRTSSYSITAIAGSSYSWTATGGSISGSKTGNSINVLWGAAGTGSVSVKQTSAFGCDSSVSKNIIIVSTPAPVISGPDSICSNRTSTYSITAIAGSTYSWTAKGGTISGSATGNSISVLWGAAGVGSVQVEQISAFGCDSSVSKNITIVPTPAPVITGPDSICSNRTSSYSITVIAGSSYGWTATGGTIIGSATGNSISVLWGAAGVGSVQVKQISAFGCDSSVSKNITIMPTPAPVISGLDSICEQHTANYSVDENTGSQYRWSVVGGVILGDATGSSILVSWGNSGQGKITVKEISVMGCDSVVSATVQLVALPTPTISGPKAVCKLNTYSYSVSSQSGVQYTWSVIGGKIVGSSISANVQVQWLDTGIGYVQLRAKNTFGCDSVLLLETTIFDIPAPKISGPLTVCSNKLNSYSSKLEASHHYVWTVSGGQILGKNNTNTVQVLWGNAGYGSIELFETNEHGCGITANKTILIQQTPSASISGPAVICNEARAVYHASTQKYSKLWTVEGGVIKGSSNLDSVVVVWGTGTIGQVTLKVFVPGACDSSTAMAVVLKSKQPVAIAGPINGCVGKSQVFQATYVDGTSYTWELSGGNTEDNQNETTLGVVFDEAGTYKATLYYTQPYGCAGVLEKEVEIFDLPIPSIEGSEKACAFTPGHTYIQGTYFVQNAGSDSVISTWNVEGAIKVTQKKNNAIIVDWGAPGLHKITLTQRHFVTGCENSTDFFVDVDTIKKAAIQVGEFTGCAPVRISFNEGTGNAYTSYSWSLGNKTISKTEGVDYNFTEVGDYKLQLIVSNEYGCLDTVQTQVSVKPRPIANFNIETKGDLFIHDTAWFKNTSQGAVRYEWNFTDGETSTSKDMFKEFETPGIFPVLLWAVNEHGCMDSALKYVDVRVKPWIYVPNAFTPNADGNNDFFSVKADYIVDFEVLILNRWGEILYRSNDVNFKWDGTYMGEPAQDGVYVYKIFARDYYGVGIPLKGDVTLLR